MSEGTWAAKREFEDCSDVFEGLDDVRGVSWKWIEAELDSRYEPTAEEQVIFVDLLERMSENARALALFLIDYPDEFRTWLGLVSRRVECKHKKCCNCLLLRKYFLQELGWSKQTVARAFREIRKKLTS